MHARLLPDRASAAILAALFEPLPHGIAVFDLESRLHYANARWRRFVQEVTDDDTSAVAGALLVDILHEQATWLHPAVQRALAGDTTRLTGVPRADPACDVCWDITLAPVIDAGRVSGFISVVDEQRVEPTAVEEALREREAQYQSIFSETTDGLVIYTLGERGIVEANPALCALTGFTRDELLGMDPLQLISPDDHQRVINAGDIVTDAGRFMLTVTVLRRDGTTFDAELNRTTFLYQGRQHGLAVVRDITARAQSFRFLEARIAERTSELQTLLEISRAISLVAGPESLTELIFDQLRRLMDYDAVAIALVERDQLDTVAARGGRERTGVPATLGTRSLVDWHDPVWRSLAVGEAVVIPDPGGDGDVARWFRRAAGAQLNAIFGQGRALLLSPLVVQHELIGVLCISVAGGGPFQQHDIDLVAATANQAAVAIQNARLHEQARAMAALEERQRLARELHDSVSQSLFGIGLGAETARAMIERDPSRALSAIDYVLQLARSGMAEMRALIFELRPESLEQQGLVAALEKQAAATSARHAVTVDLVAESEPLVPLTTKEALYRVAQEAIHNTVKHARATRVDLRLATEGDTVVLDIRDDGVGFDARGEFPGHLGLVSMRERIDQLGGSLVLTSAPGSGTRVHATVPTAAGTHLTG